MPDKNSPSLQELVLGDALSGIFAGSTDGVVYQINVLFDLPERQYALKVFTGIKAYSRPRTPPHPLAVAARVRVVLGPVYGEEEKPGLVFSQHRLPSDIGLPEELDGFFYPNPHGGDAVSTAFIPWEVAERILLAMREQLGLPGKTYLLKRGTAFGAFEIKPVTY